MAENVGGIVYTVDIDTAKTVSGTKAVNKELDGLEKGFKKADGGAKSLSGSIRQANSSFGGMSSALKGVLAPLLSVAAAVGALRKLVEVQRQFDVLNAGLVTATGSAENAAIAFDALQEFASKTPYDLNQVTKAFTQLVNLGLTPSEQALNSYGNTASAMGKDLSQLVEAVADATTGEFERLKEFGIKAKQEGDKVSLTFRGVTTNIGNNAAEIESYLIALGENEFAGAMEQRLATLDGAISNLGDTWDNTFRLIAASGAGDIIESSVRMATAALDELNAQLASGQLGANIDAIVGKFDGFGRDIDQTFTILTDLISSDTDKWDSMLGETVASMIDTFKNFPENVRALIQIMTVEVLAGFDKVTAYARAFNDGINAIFTDDTFEGVGARLEQQLAVAESARMSSLDSILAERDAALDSFDSQTKAADELRKSYDELNSAKSGQGDRLAGFKVGGDKGGGGSAAPVASPESVKAAKEQASAVAANAKAVAALKEQLYQAGLSATELAMRQAELQLNQYASPEQVAQVRALALELQRISALEQQKKAFGSTTQEVTTKITGQVDPLSGGMFDDQSARYEAEAEAERVRYADQLARLQEAKELELEVIGGYQAKEQEFAQTHADRLAQIEAAKNSAMLQSGQQLFDGLAGFASQFAGEQSALYKTMFAASKAFAVAEASLGLYTAISQAAKLSWPANIPAMAQAAASMGQIVSGVSSVTMSGRAMGGPVQASQMYRVNETGAPEIFNAANGRQYMMPNQRGDVVSNKNATDGGSGEPTVIVNIQNNADGSTATASSRREDSQTIIDVVVSNMMSNGKIAQATNRITGTKRAGG
jgi:hypothetical protein